MNVTENVTFRVSHVVTENTTALRPVVSTTVNPEYALNKEANEASYQLASTSILINLAFNLCVSSASWNHVTRSIESNFFLLVSPF